MHTFQPVPIDMIECNPFTKISKEWALVTAGSKDKVNTMTVSWGGMGIMWGKNVLYIFIRDSRYTKELIDSNGFFSVTFLKEKYRDALNYCGSHSGKDEDKFEKAGITVAKKHGIPYVDEGELVFLCHKMSATKINNTDFISTDLDQKWYAEGNYHTMYIGEIIDVLAR